MTDAAWASLATAATVIVVAFVQRSRDIAIKDVVDKTHTATNSNWGAARDRIDQLQEAMQAAGIRVPPTPNKEVKP